MMRTRPLIIFLFILFFPALAFSQEGQTGAENSLLPEINPQDIEIRSEFQARFPGLRRQPILGFNPKPRVFQIEPNRVPFMESREEAVADISVTKLGRPEPPARNKLSIPNRQTGYIRAGFGSYITPEISGYGTFEINDNSLAAANLNLRASDGHLDTQESGFRYLDFSGKYIARVQDDLRLTVDLGALSDFNHLFDLDDNIQQNFIGETSDKEYVGLSGRILLQKKKNTLTGWEFSAGGGVFEAALEAGESGLSGDQAEQVYHSSFSYYWPGQRIYETFDITGRVEYGSYDTASAGNQSWVDIAASLKYERLLNFTTRIKGTGGFEFVSDPFSDKFYFVPEIEIKHNFSNSFSITGAAFAKPKMQSLQEHHQNNRLLGNQNLLRHSYNIGFSGEATFQLFDGNRLFGGFNYTFIRDYAYYQRDEFSLSSSISFLQFYAVKYGDANIFDLHMGASQQLVPEKFWADFKVYGRSPALKSGGDIPYEEKLGAEGGISYKPLKTLTINGWAEYIGTRESPETNSELDAFVLLNAGAEYQFNETFGVYAKLLNILGQEYEIWNGYQERPFQIFGGLTIKF